MALGKDRSFLGPATDRRSIEQREAFIRRSVRRHRAGRAHTDALATDPERHTSLADIRLFQLPSDSARELRAESADI